MYIHSATTVIPMQYIVQLSVITVHTTYFNYCKVFSSYCLSCYDKKKSWNMCMETLHKVIGVMLTYPVC